MSNWIIIHHDIIEYWKYNIISVAVTVAQLRSYLVLYNMSALNCPRGHCAHILSNLLINVLQILFVACYDVHHWLPTPLMAI